MRKARGRLEVAVQNERVEVGAVGPYDRSLPDSAVNSSPSPSRAHLQPSPPAESVWCVLDAN
jgi:hypothetical protein